MGEQRRGVSVPLAGATPLGRFAEVIREAEELGYTDAWSSDTDAGDGISPLAAAAAVTSRMRLGTAITNTFTRGPATIAATAASLAYLAPGRFILGLGSSSPAIVQGWNGIPFQKPYTRTREMLQLVREALSGARVARTLETVSMQGFHLMLPPPQPVPIYLAALRPRMLRMAGELADGLIITWLLPRDVPRVIAEARQAAAAAGRDPAALEVVMTQWMIIDDDPEQARNAARRTVAAYLNTPIYRGVHEWLGNGALFGPMWERWDAGDRRGALAAIPDEALDGLVALGDPDRCRDFVEALYAQGVDTPVIAPVPAQLLLSPSPDHEAQLAQVRRWLRALAPQSVA
jgi:probable F420-dependent oxidoreductase